MDMSRRRPSYTERRKQEAVNKKAIIWSGSVVLGLIILMSVLLIVNK